MSFKAGVGVQDISPQKPCFLVGYPHVERISTGIQDPLLASALYLHNGETGVILVAIDILQIGPQTARDLRKSISSIASLPENHIFISCTHTHSGPVTMDMLAWRDDLVVPKPDPDYMSFFRENVIKAVETAIGNTKSAEIAWTTTQSKGVGGNRISPDGVADPEVGILAVRDLDKQLIALSTIYSMHPTVLHEDSKLISADFPGYTRSYLRKFLGEDLTVLYHTGTAGNQSPRYSVKAQTFEEAERLGNMLGEAIKDSILKIDEYKQDIRLAGKILEVNLPVRTMPSLSETKELLRKRVTEYKRLKKEKADRRLIRTAECAVFGAEESVTLARAQESGELEKVIQDYILTEIQLLRIGDCFLVGLQGEIFVEYGLQIKKFSPHKTFVVSLVNGDLQGYIVIPEYEKTGGYEASNSLFKAESGEILVKTAFKLVERYT